MYTSDVPCDIDAVVLSNLRLSDDYSVLALAAPEIAGLAQPGQFVMVKPSRSNDPLLRRPFSVFEILRDADGALTGISILNKRIGVGTSLIYDAEPGSRIACLGPLGRPFQPVEAPQQAWMVAGGVGLAPFLTLAEALVAAENASDALLRRAHGARSLLHQPVRTAWRADHRSRPKMARWAPRDSSPRRSNDALAALRPGEDVKLYVCGPTPMMRAVATLADFHSRPCDVSLEQVMGCGLGGCYSCVVLTRQVGAPPHFVRSCLDGPVFDAGRVVWEALAH